MAYLCIHLVYSIRCCSLGTGYRRLWPPPERVKLVMEPGNKRDGRVSLDPYDAVMMSKRGDLLVTESLSSSPPSKIGSWEGYNGRELEYLAMQTEVRFVLETKAGTFNLQAKPGWLLQEQA